MDPKDREPCEAVGWMLGPDLVGGLSKIFDRRQDPRGWMARIDGLVHDEYADCDGRLVEAEQRPATEAQPARVPDTKDAVWFDYICDAGDSGDAMYAVAVACLADLDADDALPTRIEPGASFPLVLRERQHGEQKLPRGQFLFLGGDTAYHIADEPAIRARVEEPFRWADEDLERLGVLRDTSDAPPRLYGIPANHDWYDNLDGFRVLFQRKALSNALRKPGPLRKLGRTAADKANKLLKIPGRPEATPDEKRGLGRFLREQHGSYVGIRLPHRWQLWGLDIDQPIDTAQVEYFRSLGKKVDENAENAEKAEKAQRTEPERLILCTPSPPIAFGSVIAGDAHEEAVRELGLTRAYDDEPLPPASVRLDLSGDIHHYARYASGNRANPNYAAVVSGLGGAFHHPSFSWAGPRKEITRYPTANESRTRIAERLLSRKPLFVGSWIRAFPILFTLLLGGASTAGGAFDAVTRQLFAEEPVAFRELLARLGAAGEVFTFLVVTIFFLLAGITSFNATFAEQTQHPSPKLGFRAALRKSIAAAIHPFRSYWLATVFFVAAFASVIGFAAWGRAPRGPAWLDVGAFLVVALGFIGGPILGVKVAAKHHHGSKLGFGFVGLLHGIAQVLTPWLAAHWTTAGVPSLSLQTFHACALGLFFSTGAVFATWVLLRLSQPSFARARTDWVCGFAIVAVVVPLVILWLGAERPFVHHYERTLVHLLRYGLGAFVAMLLGTAHLTWYFAVTGLMGGHNNEVGGAARITAFRQIIRFRVDADSLTGYVIRIHDRKGIVPLKRGKPKEDLLFALVDVFSLPTPPSALPSTPRAYRRRSTSMSAVTESR